MGKEKTIDDHGKTAECDVANASMERKNQDKIRGLNDFLKVLETAWQEADEYYAAWRLLSNDPDLWNRVDGSWSAHGLTIVQKAVVTSLCVALIRMFELPCRAVPNNKRDQSLSIQYICDELLTLEVKAYTLEWQKPSKVETELERIGKLKDRMASDHFQTIIKQLKKIRNKEIAHFDIHTILRMNSNEPGGTTDRPKVDALKCLFEVTTEIFNLADSLLSNGLGSEHLQLRARSSRARVALRCFAGGIRAETENEKKTAQARVQAGE